MINAALLKDIEQFGGDSTVMRTLLERKKGVPYDLALEKFLLQYVASRSGWDYSTGLKVLTSMYLSQKEQEHKALFHAEITSALSEIRRQLEFLTSLISLQLQSAGYQLVPEQEEQGPDEGVFSPQQMFLEKSKIEP